MPDTIRRDAAGRKAERVPMRYFCLICGCLSLALVAESRAGILVADSIADWTASGGAQGYNGWYYGFYNGTSADPYTNNPAGDDFHQMVQFNPTGTDFEWWHQEGPGGYWTMVGQGIQHPNGNQANHAGRLPALEWSVRRWVSSASGTIEIKGHISMGGGQQGFNGTEGHILVNGVDIYDQRVLSGNQTGFNFDLFTTVTAGQTIDFSVDPGPLLSGEYNDLFDTTKFSTQIYSGVNQVVPEPATWTLVFGAMVSLFAFMAAARARGAK